MINQSTRPPDNQYKYLLDLHRIRIQLFILHVQFSATQIRIRKWQLMADTSAVTIRIPTTTIVHVFLFHLDVRGHM
jgi:hypothetical protein